jgi:hypothetical protein
MTKSAGHRPIVMIHKMKAAPIPDENGSRAQRRAAKKLKKKKGK